MKVLVKFKKDWADEFDVFGFRLMLPEQAEKFKTNHAKNCWFGTNEGWENDDIDLSDFTFRDVTDEEAETIRKYFGTTYAVFPDEEEVEYDS